MSSMNIEYVILHVLYCTMNTYSRLLTLLVRFILFKCDIGPLSRTCFVYLYVYSIHIYITKFLNNVE